MKKSIKDYLVRDSLIILATSVLTGLFYYFFGTYTGRKLGPADYGIFGVLFSIFLIFTNSISAINMLTIRLTSYFKAKNKYDKIKTTFDTFLRIFFLSGLILFILIIIFSKIIIFLLKIPSVTPVIILGLLIWAYITLNSIQGILIGLQRFISLGLLRFLFSFFILIFGIILINLGLKVNGAMLALFLGTSLVIPIGILKLKKILKNKKSKIIYKEIKIFIIPTIISSIILAIILNIDVILIKLFFDDVQTGFYTAAAFAGKVIFFISSSFTTVIFPKTSEFHDRGKNTISLLKRSFIYITLISLFIIFVYFLIPDFLVNLFFGTKYKISNLIGLSAVAMLFYSLNNLLVNYNLSVKKFKFLYVLIPSLLLEINLIVLFHNSLLQVIQVLTIFMILLFIALLITTKK